VFLDERKGLPSASAMYRLSKCPGSLALSKWVKKGGYYEPRDPWASRGTAIHIWLMLEAAAAYSPEARAPLKEAGDDLGADDMRTALKCVELRKRLVREWAPEADNWILRPILERRYWYRAGDVARFSGQPDYILTDIENRRGLVINYKTGRVESEPAADNLQLRTEVVLLKHDRPELDEIQGAIDEPNVDWQPERVSYASEAVFKEAEGEILAIVEEATWNAKTRNAGPWCVNCAARVYCRQARDYAESALVIQYGLDVKDLPRGEAGVALWQKIGAAVRLFKIIKDNYEQILKTEPDALPGYTLPAEGNERRDIVSAKALKAALAAYLTADEVDSCATYWLGKVEEKFGEKTSMKGLRRKRAFTELIEDVLEITHDKPFIRPLTKAEREEWANQLRNRPPTKRQLRAEEKASGLVEEYDQFGRLK
jgi:hypothetical protein